MMGLADFAARAKLWAILLDGSRRLLDWKPPPPCGTKARPHLVAPGKPGDVRRCVTCCEVGTLPQEPA
jgi:hypothetical protein